MINAYDIALVLTGLFVYSFATYILLKTYFQTRFPSHLLLSLTFIFLALSYIFRFTTTFYETNTTLFIFPGSNVPFGIINLLWSFTNAFLLIGEIFVFYAFIFVKFNRFPAFINIVSFVGGAAIIGFVLPEFTTFTKSETGAWIAEYASWLLILILPLLMIFIASFVYPLIIKIAKVKTKKIRNHLIIQSIGLSIVVIWAFLAAFTSNPTIAKIRPFVLHIGWFIWALTLLIDPFNIMLSNAKINQILISTNRGLPVYYYDVGGNATAPPELAAGLIEGVKVTLEQFGSTMGKLTNVIYKDQVIGITSYGFLNAYVFGERFDKTLETVLQFLLRDLQESSEFALKITPDFVDLPPDVGLKLRQKVEETLKRVLII